MRPSGTVTRSRSGHFFARRLAAAYQRGRARASEIAADQARVAFIRRLSDEAGAGTLHLSEVEDEFVCRITCEHDAIAPNIFPGDRNIIDSLRRKYERPLVGNAGRNTVTAGPHARPASD